jgi:hypothetical protein
MKNRYNNTLLGSYLPSFFLIELCTNETLENINNLNETTKSTLYHEYVHFMQDLTTTFGLTNIIKTVDIQKAINEVIIKSPEVQFKTPISYESFYDVESYDNLNEMFLGDNQSIFSENSFITSIDLVENGIIPDFEDKLYVEIKFVTQGIQHSFAFGAISIMESMAYLIQRNLHDNVQSPFFPYRVVERIVSKIYPELTGDINLIMLCDYALNTPDPGRFLLEFLYLIKANKCTNYKEFYQILRRYKFKAKDGEEYTIYTLFEKRSKTAKQQLRDFFTIDKYQDINIWIDKIIASTSTNRLENFNFWVDILSFPTKDQRRNAFNLMISKFGFPLLSNSKMEISFYHPEIIPEYITAFMAINEVREVLMNRQTDCKLHKLCSNSEKNAINNNCKNPWKKASEDPLCPFGQIIKMWGIHVKIPIYQ